MKIVIAAVVALIIVSPVLVGVFSFGSIPAALLLVALAFSLYVFTRPAARGKSIALVLVAISFSLTLLDLTSRIFLMPIIFRHAESRLWVRPWPDMPFAWRYVANFEHEGRSFGDLAAGMPGEEHREYRTFRLVTDELGFRNEPKRVGAEAPAADVILVGDSYTAGAATTQARTWPSILEQKYGLRVYNMGIPAYGPAHSYVNFKHELPHLRTKPGRTIVLWMLFTGNDLVDKCFPPSKEPEMSWPDRFPAVVSFRSFRRLSPVHEVLRLAQVAIFNSEPVDNSHVLSGQLLGSTVLFFRGYAGLIKRTPDEVKQHPNYACVEATIDAMERLAAANQLKLAIVLAPSKEEIYSWVLEKDPAWSTSPEPSGFSTVLGEISRRENIPFLDLRPFFVHASQRVFEDSRQLLWWRDDTHWNALGNTVAARLIYNHLLVPLRNERSSPRELVHRD